MTAFGRNLLATPSLVADAAIDRSRQAAIATARALGAAKTPSHTLAEASLRANAAAGETVAHLVKSNVQVLDGFLDEGVRRLERMAEADSWRALVTEQIELLADTRARLSADVRRTLAILVDARARITDALAGALVESGTTRSDAPQRALRARAKKATAKKRPQKRAASARRRAR
jgi:hypothetical protein